MTIAGGGTSTLPEGLTGKEDSLQDVGTGSTVDTSNVTTTLKLVFNVKGAIASKRRLAFNVLATKMSSTRKLLFNVLDSTLAEDNSFELRVNGAPAIASNIRLVKEVFTPESNGKLRNEIYFDSFTQFNLGDSVEVFNDYVSYRAVVHARSDNGKQYSYSCYGSEIYLQDYAPTAKHIDEAFSNAISQGFDFETPMIKNNPIISDANNLEDMIMKFGKVTGNNVIISPEGKLLELPDEALITLETDVDLPLLLEDPPHVNINNVEAPSRVIGIYKAKGNAYYEAGELSNALFDTVSTGYAQTYIHSTGMFGKGSVKITGTNNKYWIQFTKTLDKKVWARGTSFSLWVFMPYADLLAQNHRTLSVMASGEDIDGNPRQAQFSGTYVSSIPYVDNNNNYWWLFLTTGNTSDLDFFITSLSVYLWPVSAMYGYFLISGLTLFNGSDLKVAYGTSGKTKTVKLVSTDYDAAVQEVQSIYNALQVQTGIEFATPLRITLIPPVKVHFVYKDTDVTLKAFKITHDLVRSVTTIQLGTGVKGLIE